MGEHSEAFVAFDVDQKKHAAAIAEGGRTGEVRFVGEAGSDRADDQKAEKKVRSTARLLRGRADWLRTLPSGPRSWSRLHGVAPALIPKLSGERVKTNRRDAVTLARLHRAGELTEVWVPDIVHEAVRDLIRAREAAADDLRRKRQQLLSFLLCHGRIYEDGGHWTLAHRRWACPPELRAYGAADRVPGENRPGAVQRLRRLDGQVSAIVPNWSTARVVVEGLSGDARRLIPGGSDLRGRDRRCAPLRYTGTVDGLPRPGSGGAFDRRHGPHRALHSSAIDAPAAPWSKQHGLTAIPPRLARP